VILNVDSKYAMILNISELQNKHMFYNIEREREEEKNNFVIQEMISRDINFKVSIIKEWKLKIRSWNWNRLWKI